jgi:putative acetyltransferase
MNTTNITLKRTDSNNSDFQNLIISLDKYLEVMNGDLHSFYAPNNKFDYLDTVVLAYHNDLPVGCGCFKKFDDSSIEIKRMYVDPAIRSKGIASVILTELEQWAKEKGFTHAVLETCIRFKDAVKLYQKNGYDFIERYEPYVNAEDSICMKKEL